MKAKSEFRILVVEDDFLIASQLQNYLEDLHYSVVSVCDSAEDSLKVLQKEMVDLVLLDIQLQGHMDGVDLALVIRNHYKTPVLFISSHTAESIIERIRHTGASGFITKPFTLEDLSTNIELIRCKEPTTEVLSAREEEAFYIKHKQEFVRVPLGDILYAEAMDNYTVLYTGKGKFILPQTLKQVGERLEAFGFFRTHRSYLVQKSKINSVLQGYVLVGEDKIPLSENNRNLLLKELDIL